MPYQTIYELFQETSGKYGRHVAFQHKRHGRWIDTTWTEARLLVERVSRALIGLGVAKGDTVTVLSQTRLEWVLVDYGNVCRGSVTVGIYPSNLAKDCAYIANHSESVLMFVENRDQLDKILSMSAELPRLRHIVIFDGPTDESRGILSWQDFLARGDAVPRERAAEAAASLRSDDLASLVYTSGTTGVPKGVMLSHGNLLCATHAVSRRLGLRHDYTMLLFLPLAHVFARLAVYMCMHGGVTTAFTESLDKLPQNLREIRPHFIPSAPRLYEKFYDKITSGARRAGGLKLWVFNWAVGVGRRVSRLQQEGRPIPPLLRLRRAVAQKLVLGKIQAAFGGRLVFAISGAAPLNRKIAEFFHACGVLILEGIGMTENSSFSNVNAPEDNKFGTVGKAGEGIEVRIAEDGEVLFRGKNVMLGYFKNPEATAEAIDAQGWLHSGDIGELDEEGYLRITDRKKDLLITAGGKNVAPQRIERILRESPYIAQVMAYGDRRKYITALITLEMDNLRTWAAAHGLDGVGQEELAAHPRVHELIRGEIERANRQLASYETVKRFHIAPRDFSIEGGELTPTQKLRRKVIVDKYRDALDALY